MFRKRGIRYYSLVIALVAPIQRESFTRSYLLNKKHLPTQ